MSNANKKIILLSYVCLAAISGLVVRVLFESFASIAFVGRIWAVESTQHIVPVAVGVAVFLILQLNSRIYAFSDEVVTEIRKVVWPTKAMTTQMTIVTCIMLVIAGIILGVFDFASSTLVKQLITF